jgi:hypothetical protein
MSHDSKDCASNLTFLSKPTVALRVRKQDIGGVVYAQIQQEFVIEHYAGNSLVGAHKEWRDLPEEWI